MIDTTSAGWTGAAPLELRGGNLNKQAPPPPKNLRETYVIDRLTDGDDVYRWRTGEECFDWWMNPAQG